MIVASPTAFQLIKKFEGLRLKAYYCSAGKATIGYGHTHNVKLGQVITEEQADEFLKTDVELVVNDLNALIKVSLNQNQADALISFVYNIGVGAFGASSMLKKINQNKLDEVPAQFLKWVYIKGKISKGLINRRKEEANLFLK